MWGNLNLWTSPHFILELVGKMTPTPGSRCKNRWFSAARPSSSTMRSREREPLASAAVQWLGMGILLIYLLDLWIGSINFLGMGFCRFFSSPLWNSLEHSQPTAENCIFLEEGKQASNLQHPAEGQGPSQSEGRQIIWRNPRMPSWQFIELPWGIGLYSNFQCPRGIHPPLFRAIHPDFDVSEVQRGNWGAEHSVTLFFRRRFDVRHP